MEEKKTKETILFTDKKLTVEGKTFDVRLCFPTAPTDSVTDKLMCLVTGKTHS